MLLKPNDIDHCHEDRSSDEELIDQLSEQWHSKGNTQRTPEEIESFNNHYLKFVEDLAQRCLVAKDSQFNAAKYWDMVNRSLGLSAAVLGVIGGSAAFVAVSDQLQLPTIIAGLFSIMAGLFAATNSYLEPSERHQAHKRAGDEWSILMDQYTELGQLEVYRGQSPDKLLSALNELLKQKERVTRGSPVIQERFYLKAKNDLKQIAHCQ